MKSIILVSLITPTLAFGWGNASQQQGKGSQAQSYGDTAIAQSQAQGQKQTQSATGGNSVAYSAGGNGGSATGGNASNSGVSESNSYQSGPALAASAAIITGCSVAGTAGGANTRAAGFLGIAFVPAECKRFMAVQAYAALGERKAACEVLARTKTIRELTRDGFTPPSCESVVTPAPAPEPQPQIVEVPVYIPAEPVAPVTPVIRKKHKHVVCKDPKQ